MTVRRLRGEIHTAVADGRLDLREERRIEGTTGDALSNAEARELGALYDRLTTTRPGTAERPYATQTSFEALRRLFAENGQPYGPNRSVVVEQLRRYFEIPVRRGGS